MKYCKHLLKRPFTSSKHHSLALHLVEKPPLPESMYDAAAGTVGKKDILLHDFWGESFSQHLDEITGQKGWQGQRSALLKIGLAEEG